MRYADLPSATVRAVYVNTKSGNTLRGVLVGLYDDALVLRSSSLHNDENNTWQKMEGDLVIPIDNVDYFLDALPAAALEA